MGEELAGKVAIVTGGASGMGRSTVERFVEENCHVVVADVQDELGLALAERLGRNVTFRHTDVSKPDDVRSLVEWSLQRFGHLDVMFNNAGVLAPGGTVDLLQDDFVDFFKTMAVDLYGVMLGTRFAARAMAQRGNGSIINTASTTATLPGIGILSYRAAKAAVWNFTQNAAIALGQHGIRVNAISPGPIATDILTLGMNLSKEKAEAVKIAAFGALMQQRQPLKRLGVPQDIAEAALFLASDRASHVTGINLTVSGGEHLGDAVDSTSVFADVIRGVFAD